VPSLAAHLGILVAEIVPVAKAGLWPAGVVARGIANLPPLAVRVGAAAVLEIGAFVVRCVAGPKRVVAFNIGVAEAVPKQALFFDGVARLIALAVLVSRAAGVYASGKED